MKAYGTAAAFRRALEDRLANLAEESGQSVLRLRKLIVFDRLLARLVAVAPDAWRLKGAVALEYRLGGRSRATMDVDVEQGPRRVLEEDLLRAQEVDLDDWFSFRIVREDTDQDDVPGSVRFRVEAELAGRVFERIPLDVAPRSAIPGEDREAEILSGPPLLEFAGIPPVKIPGVSLEQHLAEKVHAYTRVYARGGRSSRPKDLVDILLIRGSARISARKLRRALEATFRERDTHELPECLPAPPEDWEISYSMLARQVGVEPDLLRAYGLAAGFVDPVLIDPGRRLG